LIGLLTAKRQLLILGMTRNLPGSRSGWTEYFSLQNSARSALPMDIDANTNNGSSGVGGGNQTNMSVDVDSTFFNAQRRKTGWDEIDNEVNEINEPAAGATNNQTTANYSTTIAAGSSSLISGLYRIHTLANIDLDNRFGRPLCDRPALVAVQQQQPHQSVQEASSGCRWMAVMVYQQLIAFIDLLEIFPPSAFLQITSTLTNASPLAQSAAKSPSIEGGGERHKRQKLLDDYSQDKQQPKIKPIIVRYVNNYFHI
jgi:hypothetical protein